MDPVRVDRVRVDRERVDPEGVERERFSPDFSPKLALQVSCRAELVFEFGFERTGGTLPRGLPLKAQNGLALALIRSGEAFSGRLARQVLCAAWNRGRKSST